jgi:hypothetical protein
VIASANLNQSFRNPNIILKKSHFFKIKILLEARYTIQAFEFELNMAFRDRKNFFKPNN